MNDTRNLDSFGARSELETSAGTFVYYRLGKLEEDGLGKISRLPFSIRVLLESLLRNEDGKVVTQENVRALAAYDPKAPEPKEIPFKPARVILQDFTGVPAVVDLAAMRSAMARFGKDPKRINPQVPADLVIDHSVQVDYFDDPQAVRKNMEKEFERNRERYEFLKWGQNAFQDFRVIPPGSGIIHQVNLEWLGQVVRTREIGGVPTAFFDSLVGTDSHTTMIDGLGIVGWGVGGIEAEAVMLDQPIFMLPPPVVGVRITGSLPEGTTPTDAVLKLTQVLRAKGVVGKFVEFFGPGLESMTVADRAMLANMAPEYGATMGFFPVDGNTLDFLRQTGRSEEQVELVEAYCKAQGMFRTSETPDPEFQEVVEFDLSLVEPCMAGPKRPQDRILLKEMKSAWKKMLAAPVEERGFALDEEAAKRTARAALPSGEAELGHGAVVIAAITSCTNTSDPFVLVGAGLVAKKAVEAGLARKPWVKTSLAPGSRVVTEYLRKAGLLPYLEKLGFSVVGYGCTTCIGNSGPLPDPVRKAIQEGDLVAAGVLSGNRNFEGRVNPFVKANFLASPPLVVAYALAGTVDFDPFKEPLGTGKDGKPVYMKDVWPTSAEIQEALSQAVTPEMFKENYDGILEKNELWNAIPAGSGELYHWPADSTYIQEIPLFKDMPLEPPPIVPIEKARVLVKVGDSVTTDHISPAGPIPLESPAARYLMEKGVKPEEFNTYGSRRGNDRVMTRGTFGNIRLRNQLAPGTEGGWTTSFLDGKVKFIFDAAEEYKAAGIPTIVLAGKDYGMGSSRDWAAKGTALLGIKAVIAESFERIHRSNLVGMGVLPLQFKEGEDAETLGLTGKEVYTIHVDDSLRPAQDVKVDVAGEDGKTRTITLRCRLDSPIEVEYYRNGGILQTVQRRFLKD